MPNVHGNLYEKLSEERKALVVSGENPDWFTTAAWQLFKDKISYKGANVFPTFKRISTTLSGHMPDSDHWEPIFYELLSKSLLSPSTPVISNTGTDKGYPVSCSGQNIGDSIDSFYKNLHETAQLTKFGFGVSGNLSGIRPRGTPYGVDGKADGVVPVIKTYVQAMRAVSQGSSRRGAWAGYLNVDHGDFFEVADYLLNNPDDLNMGWIFTRAFIARLEANDEDAIARYQRVMFIRAVFGKGYIWKNDHANEQSPALYKAHGVSIKASNLCSEIALYSNDFETFTCVLSSLNLSNWDKFDKDTIFNSIVFLHCVALEFISKADGESGMEKAVLFTKKNMALGLGTLGFHTYLQQNMIPMESFDANTLNNQIYKKIKEESVRASEWLATVFGEPEMCKGTGRANTHLMAIAPNMSSAIMAGGVSQGIEPVIANVYTQATAGGEMERINPVLLGIMKERGHYNQRTINRIANDAGSVQKESWLSDHEKLVFKTAYEIDQTVLVRLASNRQRWVCQGQSLNLFFSADEDEGYISSVHRLALLDKRIKGLYYMRSAAGVQSSKGECIACEG